MTQFDELGLPEEILKALREMGYETLTPIQEKSFAVIREGRDVLALAETGSGKTSACAIPLMEHIDPSNRKIQVLILVPTRELALQYVDEIDRVSQYTEIAPFAVYGGSPIDIQKGKLDHGVHVLVATPGRLIDLLYNSTLSLGQVRTVVLDEADEMLKMGFIEDVDFILSCILQEHQTLLFSATMPREIEMLIDRYLNDFVKVELIRERAAPISISHHFQYVGRDSRFEALKKYLKTEAISQAIIFCNSRDGGEKLFRKLRNELDDVDFIHGGIEQDRRTSIYNKFKRKKIRIMVATDIASRGLDFSHVSHVINYDYPRTSEAYTHRTGRTGRMGRTGIAMTYIKEGDLRAMASLLRKTQVVPKWIGEEPDLTALKKRGKRKKGRGKPGSGSQTASQTSHTVKKEGNGGSSNKPRRRWRKASDRAGIHKKE